MARAPRGATSAPHLFHIFPSFRPGGVELRTVRLIEALGGEFRHSILALDGRTGAAERLSPEAPVRLVAAPPKAGSAATVARLRRLLRRERPDLLLTYNWGAIDALFAAATLGWRRAVHHEDGFNADEAGRPKRRRALVRRLALPRAHRVVVPSERLRALATGSWGLPPARVRLIPNGVRLDRFAPGDGGPALRDRLGIPAGAPVVGTVGALRPVKNLRRLLEAVAAADSGLGLHLLVVGDGAEREALAGRAARPDLAGRVHWAGDQADPAPFYRAMDLFALTSDSEQMPVALVEAMATGLPAVATDVGDVRAMLPPEQAPFLVPPGQGASAALARGFSALLGDRGLARRLGAANRRRAEETYGFERMRQAFREVYRETLALGAAAPRAAPSASAPGPA